jgi:hypothetical protein
VDISYLGENRFLIRGEGTVAVNPERAVPDATVTLHGSKQKRNAGFVNGPGEYEIGGVLIVSLAVGERGSGELAHSFEVGDLNIVYLGDRLHALTERDVMALGAIDVLIINANSVPLARETVRDLTPRVVIPFGIGAEDLVKSLGIADPQPQAKFSWNGVTKAPAAVLLKAPRGPKSRNRAA